VSQNGPNFGIGSFQSFLSLPPPILVYTLCDTHPERPMPSLAQLTRVLDILL
jgi:hypothetical protein